MSIKLEVCVSDPDSICAAKEGGADRMELCTSLETGGITPSAAFIEMAVDSGIPVNVLIRPRSGDFLYNEKEKEIMLADIKMARECGVNGVVIGALNADGSIDEDFLKNAVVEAGNCETTFHRAFDVCRNPLQALAILKKHGVTRLLTSGCAPSAMKGASLIKQLVDNSEGKISIMAGAGVNPKNAKAIIDATGVTELHASAKHSVGSNMTYRNESVNMGTSESDEYTRPTTDAETVKAIKLQLK